MSVLSEILERTKGGTFVGGLTWTDVQTSLQWLLDENARLRGQRDALVKAFIEFMEAVTPELTGMPKNVCKSTWASQWDRAQAALAAAKDAK